MKYTIGNVNRRSFLKTGAVVSGGIVAGGMPLSQVIWAAEGKVLSSRADAEPNTLDPAYYTSQVEVDVMNCIYSKLTQYKTGSEWGWDLDSAENIEQVDPTHIRFRLRKGIKFTGGHGELTAKDVKFSFERIVKDNTPVKVEWGPLDRVEIEDDYTGVMIFKTPYVPVWSCSFPHGVGQIVSEDAVMKAAKGGGNFGTIPPACSGPYVLTEWKKNQYLLLSRNPDWAGAKPGFDEIRILTVTDDKAAERAYQASDIDYTAISLDSLATLKAAPPVDTKIEKFPSLNYVWIGMNIDHPKLKDINVRKAIQWAINVPQILDAAYSGQAQVATGTIATGMIGHREKALIPPEGDLAKAKEFLEKAGVTELALTLNCLNDSTDSTIAQVVQAQLSQIGVTVAVNAQDPGSFWSTGMVSEGDRWKDLQLNLMHFSSAPDPHLSTTYFVREQVGVWNWERFSSERFDELSAKAVTISDPTERAKLYYEMQDLMEESGAYRFLTNEARPLIYRTTKVKPGTRPDGLPLYVHFEPVSA
ncbi:ABC transporter substrate-binding protein [Mesorhizobium sp. M0387]